MQTWPFMIIGPLFITIGVLQVIFRARVANTFAAARRKQWGGGAFGDSAAKTQTPALMAIGGGVFFIVGFLMTITVFFPLI